MKRRLVAVGRNRPGIRQLPAVVGLLAIAGCSAGGGNDGAPGTLPLDPGGPGTGGGGGDQVAGTGGQGGAGTVTTLPDGTTCVGTEVVAPKRLVRLSFNQIANSVRSLLGNELADTLSTTFEIGNPEARTFPPLANPREGINIGDAVFPRSDGIVQAAAQYVLANFATVTGCGDVPTDACGQQFMTQFMGRAFRRPVTDAELGRVLAVYTGVVTGGGTIQEAVQFGIYAVLESPHFLYRTELGGDALTTGALAPYELASQLSYFLTDAPPDDLLLQAAAQGQLATREQIVAHVDRTLQTDAARINLQTAMLAYFGIPSLDLLIIDTAVAPTFTIGLRNAMRREAQEFINYTLWNEPVQTLLTSRRGFVEQGLANVYGVPYPPVGATLDAEGYAVVELPENRAGLLTQAGFLTTRARPQGASVVGRGLLLNASILCGINPPFPEALQAQINAASASLEGSSERELANYRQTTAPCSSCHVGFDPFGVALLNYDVIGQFVQVDPEGRPIDASVMLPPNAGSVTVANAIEMANQLANGSNAFAACIGSNLIRYSLAEGASVTVNTCAAQAVATSFAASPDQSFSSLVREVAASNPFAMRAAGGAL